MGARLKGGGHPAAAPAPRPTWPRPALRTPGRLRCPDLCPFPDSTSPWSLAGHLSFLSPPEVSDRVPLVLSCHDAAPLGVAVPEEELFPPFLSGLWDRNGVPAGYTRN